LTTSKLKKCTGTQAVVSSARIEASRIGIDILKKGGNVVDAAVAVGFALGVCEPSTSGLGGGGFMLLRLADQTEPVFLDFRETAPRKASENMWRRNPAGRVADHENAIGGKSIGVPGEAAGLFYALHHYGTMDKASVINPAAELADSGFTVTPMMESHFKKGEPFLKKYEGSRRVYSDENIIRAGRICRNPELAAVLRSLASHPDDWFYTGELADRMIADIRKDGGVMTKEDLEHFVPVLRAPVQGTYRGYRIYSSNLPSSGGTHIIQMLNILENFEVGALKVNSAEYLHLFSEAFKKVYADRAGYMADADFYEVPVRGLTDKAYARHIAAGISLERCSPVSVEDPWQYEHPDTTHYSIGDSRGNLVSVTKTINHFCGSCLVPEGTGFLLNDTLADFSTAAGDINAVAPLKKPLSTMSPTIILKDGKPFAVLGSPGGERIICTMVQVISKLIDHGMDIAEAIASPRMTENTKNKIVYESRMAPAEISRAEQLGHRMEQVLPYDIKMGGMQGVVYLPDGTMEGSADPRRDGVALGY